jgi:hypothetical protein
MKSLIEVIEIFSLKQFMDEREHPITKSELVQALWFLRNYRDLLMSLTNVYEDIDYIKQQYQKDLNQ